MPGTPNAPERSTRLEADDLRLRSADGLEHRGDRNASVVFGGTAVWTVGGG